MPVVRGLWAELLAPGLNMETFNSYRQFPEYYSRVNKVKPSTRAYEDDFRIAGFGPLAKKPELTTTILDEPLKIGGQRYTNYTYSLGVAISQEMRDDSQYPEILALAAELGRSSYWTTELYGHDVWNNAFATTKYTGRDAKALCATDHPIQGPGTTVGNRPLVDCDISEAALEAAVLAFDSQVNERGMPIMLRPAFVLHTPSDKMFVRRLLQSAGFPGNNYNDINPLQEEGLQAICDPWLTDSDAWFLIAQSSEIDVRFYWREKPDTKTWDDDQADATFHKIRQRHASGFGDWRGVYGSPGA